MAINFNEVMSDIRRGASTKIYFSAKSLWWTHLKSDLIEATERGHAYKLAIAKREGRGVYVRAEGETDPLGEPVKVFPKPGLWMKNSSKQAGSFGKHGLRAFMKAHHQNTSTYFSNKWADYNNLIDQERK